MSTDATGGRRLILSRKGFDSDFGGTINTCTFVSPTQIMVNLTIAANALLGGHNVIVTNADGQSATFINGFTITQDLGNTVKLGEAPLVGRPITTYASGSNAARVYRDLAREVIELAPN